MVRRATFRDPISIGFRLFIVLPQLPIILMAVPDDTQPWQYLLVGGLFTGTIVVALCMHAFIALRAEAIRIGFMPIFCRTISYRNIATVHAIEVDPMRDYNGWGIKGRSHQPKGMLFSDGSQNGVRLTLRDNRRYIVIAEGPVDRIVSSFQELIDQSECHR